MGRCSSTTQAASRPKSGTRSPSDREWSASQYYEARAFEALGQGDRAVALYEGLRAAGESRARRTGSVDFFAKFGERESAGRARADAQYLIGLGQFGLGHRREARAAFEEALRADVSHVWAGAMLAEVSP